MKKVKHLSSKIWFFVILVGIIVFVANYMIPKDYTTTTTMPVTTLKTTTLALTTMLTTTMPSTTTITNVTTTIQVRKPISIMAFSCDYETDVLTLTISNKGNTRIEEDELKIYINDEYVGTFGKAIEPGSLEKNSIQGKPGSNAVEVVSPSNSARIVKYCF